MTATTVTEEDGEDVLADYVTNDDKIWLLLIVIINLLSCPSHVCVPYSRILTYMCVMSPNNNQSTPVTCPHYYR